MADIRKGDIGTELVVVVVDEGDDAINVSAASLLEIYLQKPGGDVLAKTAVLDGSGADGKIKYETVLDDLDEEGVWQIQGRVTLSAKPFGTAVGSFQVSGTIY